MIVGLVGPNGAGKSTLFNVMSGLLGPSRGKLRLDGEDITHTRPQVRAGMGLSRTFQHPELFTGLTVREHLVIAHRVRQAKRRIWTDLFTMGSVHPATTEEQANVHALIMVGVTLLVVANIALRLNAYHTSAATPVGLMVLSVAIAALVGWGATYGGSLVFDYGFNVETAGDSPVWHASESDVLPGAKHG